MVFIPLLHACEWLTKNELICQWLRIYVNYFIFLKIMTPNWRDALRVLHSKACYRPMWRLTTNLVPSTSDDKEQRGRQPSGPMGQMRGTGLAAGWSQCGWRTRSAHRASELLWLWKHLPRQLILPPLPAGGEPHGPDDTALRPDPSHAPEVEPHQWRATEPRRTTEKLLELKNLWLQAPEIAVPVRCPLSEERTQHCLKVLLRALCDGLQLTWSPIHKQRGVSLQAGTFIGRDYAMSETVWCLLSISQAGISCM